MLPSLPLKSHFHTLTMERVPPDTPDRPSLRMVSATICATPPRPLAVAATRVFQPQSPRVQSGGIVLPTENSPGRTQDMGRPLLRDPEFPAHLHLGRYATRLGAPLPQRRLRLAPHARQDRGQSRIITPNSPIWSNASNPRTRIAQALRCCANSLCRPAKVPPACPLPRCVNSSSSVALVSCPSSSLASRSSNVQASFASLMTSFHARMSKGRPLGRASLVRFAGSLWCISTGSWHTSSDSELYRPRVDKEPDVGGALY
jgi:hypothetical protein